MKRRVLRDVILRLATRGMAGVHEACGRGHAVGGMLLVNDGSVMDPISRRSDCSPFRFPPAAVL
jgi:hypothetical protein